VKWKGVYYRQGDLMPEHFTERDRMHNAFTNRIARVELPDEPEETKPKPSKAKAKETPPPDPEKSSEEPEEFQLGSEDDAE
jgi:hypothetical protein